jgi:hypothetical protein
VTECVYLTRPGRCSVGYNFGQKDPKKYRESPYELSAGCVLRVGSQSMAVQVGKDVPRAVKVVGASCKNNRPVKIYKNNQMIEKGPRLLHIEYFYIISRVCKLRGVISSNSHRRIHLGPPAISRAGPWLSAENLAMGARRASFYYGDLLVVGVWWAADGRECPWASPALFRLPPSILHHTQLNLVPRPAG